MSTIDGRGGTALLVIDVQNGVVDGAVDRDGVLARILAAAGVDHLVITGAETDACVRSTIHGAFTRGYDVTLVGDAHTTGDKSDWGAPPPADVIAHTNLYWRFQDAPGRRAAVVDAADVAFSTPPAGEG